MASSGFCWHSQTKWAELCSIEMSSETPRWHYSLVFLSCGVVFFFFFAINMPNCLFYFNRKVTFYISFQVSFFFFLRLPALPYLPSFFSPHHFSYLLPQPSDSCHSLFPNLPSFFPSSLTPQIQTFLEWVTLLGVLSALPNVISPAQTVPSALWIDYPIKPKEMSLT